METPTLIAYAAAAAIVMRLAAELALSWLNERHVRAHAAAVPEPFRGMIDEPTYAKSVAYTLARGRFGRVADSCQALVLLAVLYSGVLPAGLAWFGAHLGSSSWAVAAFLFAAGAGMSLPTLPLEWYADFRIERRFGFSTITPRTWWTDRVKGFLLSAALGYPLIALVLKIVEWAGARWWILAWATIVCFQLVMTVLAPVLILPLFNRFTPLPEGGLRARLLALAARTRFRARDIQVMDGSRRSHHSNAFFTGLGRFRKIVLFDTLMRQLTEPELEAVLAHEIGHFRRRHVPQLLIWSIAMAFVALAIVSQLARAEAFYRAFGFAPGHVAPALLLFALLAGTFTFWISPLGNWLSRRHEYQADAFAATAMSGAAELIAALRKLAEKNLGNLTPHPLYSLFYDSHPPLLARERALLAGARAHAASAGL